MFLRTKVNQKKADEKAYLEKLQKNRSKAAKSRKGYWQDRIDDFFLNGIVK